MRTTEPTGASQLSGRLAVDYVNFGVSAYANASNQSVEFAQRTERSTIKAELKIQQITGRVRMTHDR